MLALLLVLALASCKDKQDEVDTGDTSESTSAESTTEQEPIGKYHNVTASQIEKEQKVAVKWENGDGLKSVSIKVVHGDMIVSEKTVEGEGLSDEAAELYAYYGSQNVVVTTTDSDGAKREVSINVPVVCGEYVIAPISGSMPQLYFTLNMKEITKDYTIPAFVWLARPGSWNWSELPNNVYAMPTVDISEVLTHNNYNRMVEVTDAYIEELLSIDPDARFHLYINDYNTYLYPKLMAGNGIKEENYDVVLLSDGGASYSEFQKAFNIEEDGFDAEVKYAEMANNLKTLMSEVRAANDYNWTQKFTVDTTAIRQYAYVIAKEMTNVEWWLLRPRTETLSSTDSEFVATLLANDVLKANNGVYENTENNVIVERNFATPLTVMSDDDKADLKKLYNFNNEMFEEASKQGKKAMMFLGSWATASNEPDFEAYVSFMKAYYGDEFVYYYKGHPSTPTSNYPEKAAQLEKLGLIDVESSINAELILFFYPDIYMCGYNSSTFMSAEKDEMAGAIFNMKKEDCTNDYASRIGVFVSKLAQDEYAKYSECSNAEHEYFLVGYNHTESIYEYSIFDATEGKIINGPKKA